MAPKKRKAPAKPRGIHEWEDGGAAGSDSIAGKPWEQDGYLDSETDSEEELSPAAVAASGFLDELLELYYKGIVSARSFCVLNHFASLAGIADERVRLYGKGPGSSSGNYQKHLDHVLGFADAKKKFYYIDTIGSVRGEPDRVPITIPMKLPHLALAEDVADTPSMHLKLTEAIEANSLPPAYTRHPLVAGNPGPVYPLSLYMDGVAYSEVDTVTGVWLQSEVFGTRHILALVRKSSECQCGCRGHCTWFPILECLKWSLAALSTGYHPDRRHDRSTIRASDHSLLGLENQPLGFQACVLYMKGDWAEFSTRFGFPPHNDGIRPCFLCAVPPDRMCCPRSYNLSGGPWHTNTAADYEAAAARCEQPRLLSASSYAKVKALLQFDSRPTGSHGLALIVDVPEANLLAGDRVEPTPEMPDVGRVFDIADVPCNVLFWRVAEQTLVHHRCGLWSRELHMSPELNIAVDLLHTWYLGPVLLWARETLWCILDSRIWSPAGGVRETADGVSLNVINAELRSFYKAWDEGSQHKLSRINRITRKMLGKPSSHKLRKVKAIQAWGLVLFLVKHFLPKYLPSLCAPAQILFEAGQLMVVFIDTCKSVKGAVSIGKQQLMLDTYTRIIVLLEPLDMAIPKFHLMLHLIQRCGFLGSPVVYQCFLDESLNSTLKKCLRLAHTQTFELTGLLKLGEVLQSPAMLRRRD